jgi:chemotaxis response regulator CheB
MIKILVVDENEEFRTFFKEMIMAQNDQCLELPDATELDTFYRKHTPDIIIIDLEMKNVNTFSIVKQFTTEFPQVRVFIISAFYDERLKMKVLEAGAAAFISKENLYDLYKIINDNPEPVNFNHSIHSIS